MAWKAPCAACGGTVENGAGIFCANFCESRGDFAPCRKAWHGRCYRPHPMDRFPVNIKMAEDDDDPELVTEEMEETRHAEARDGDHFITPFQCDLCHFRNVQQRNPVPVSGKDVGMFVTIRRANLDAFWGREPGTVSTNLATLRRGYTMGSGAGMREPLPPRGPFPLRDDCGMKAAYMLLENSLRPGKYAGHLQWDSARGMTTAYANAYMSGVDSLRGSVMAKDDKKMMVTTCPTRSLWYERFSRGAKLRIGVIRKQNYALTEEMVHRLLDVLDEAWWAAEENSQDRKEIAELACYVLATYCGGLRGEEVPLISLKGMLEYWEETRNHRNPHLVLALRGRFKGETDLRWHMLPQVEVTSSGIQIRVWWARLLGICVANGRRGGWVFARADGRRGKVADYDARFHAAMLEVKERYPGVLPENVDPAADMSLWRSGRRGSTTEVQNKDLDPIYLNMNNRWRRKERARGEALALDMPGTYTQMEGSLEAGLKYSRIL